MIAILIVAIALHVLIMCRFPWTNKEGGEWLFRAWRYASHRLIHPTPGWVNSIDARRTEYAVRPRRLSFRLRFWDWSERGAVVDTERYNEVVEWEKSQGYK